MRDPTRLIAAVLAAVLAAGVTIELIDNGPDRPPGTPAKKITVTVGKGANEHPTTVTVDADQQFEPEQKAAVNTDLHDQTEQGSGASSPVSALDVHEDMRDETPPGVPASVLDAAAKRNAQIAQTQLKDPEPPAGAQIYNCVRRPVVNQSALTQKPVGVALHFTVSPWGSINAIHDLFNRPSFGASSNFGFELTGQCQEWVRVGRKAWAQLSANSAYVSIEIVTNDLTRAQWLGTRAFKRGILAALVRDLLRQVGAPARLVDPVDCVWPAGVTDHSRLECGNTHWDVGTHFPWDVFMRQVRSGVTTIRPVDRQRCRAQARYRRRVRHRKHVSRDAHAHRRANLRKQGLRCKSGKPVSRRR